MKNLSQNIKPNQKYTLKFDVIVIKWGKVLKFKTNNRDPRIGGLGCSELRR